MEYTLKLSEQLNLKGVPDTEKSEKVSELIHLHKEVKERIAEYDDIFSKTVKFHHVKEEVSIVICNLMKTTSPISVCLVSLVLFATNKNKHNFF